MVITINKKDHEIIFGVGFVRAMDAKYFVTNKSGIKFGTGLSTKIPFLLAHDVVTLAEFLYEGTCTEKTRPTQAEVDAYIDGVEDIETLYDEVLDELKKHNATRATTLELEQSMKAAEAKTTK